MRVLDRQSYQGIRGAAPTRATLARAPRAMTAVMIRDFIS
jgi:hypothetical protein